MTNELGTYLRSCREKARKSQGEVARELGYTSPQFISNVERGVSKPPIESCGAWFEAMGADKDKAIKIWVDEFKRYLMEQMYETK